MTLLPKFDESGVLPPGEYELTLGQLRDSVLVTGPDSDHPGWDVLWRWELVDRFETLVLQLWHVGVKEVFIGGSFVEDVSHPVDIDGYFTCDLNQFASGELEQELNLLDPHKIWTWDPAQRRPYRNYPKKQLPMWHQYRVDLYPHFSQWDWLKDSKGLSLEFPAAFRRSRLNGRLRGIVKIGGAK